MSKVTITHEKPPGAPDSWLRHIVRVDGERVGAHVKITDAISHKEKLKSKLAGA